MTHPSKLWREPTPGHNPDAELPRLCPSWDEDAQARIAAFTADPILFRTRRVIAEEAGR